MLPKLPLELVNKILIKRGEHPLAKIINDFNKNILDNNMSDVDLYNYIKNRNDRQVPMALLIYIMRKVPYVIL